MNKNAVLHIPLSQYAYALDEHRLVLRIRTAKNDVEECQTEYGDRVDQHQPIRMKTISMRKIASDDLFDYFSTVIEDHYTRVCYYFKLMSHGKTIYYYQRGFCEKMNDNRTEYFQFPYIRREDMIQVPEWLEQTVLYQIFPDSFANGKGELNKDSKLVEMNSKVTACNRLGGTLQGICENIPYLEELGINGIYLNPVFTAASYHKYDTIDYFQIDPCFGTNEDLKHLVTECHKKGIKVLLDGVFNHCGSTFFAFQDVLRNGQSSRYYDWFYDMPCPVEYKDPPNYEAFAYVKEMPKLNTGNQEVADYFCKVGRFWVEEADIDGWRLDVANEINHDFWRQFRREVRQIKPAAVFIGEIWENAENWLLGGDQFDSTMNYPFSYLCRDFFAEQSISAREFNDQLQKMLMRYPEPLNRVQMNMLDSHDVPRFLTYCKGDRKKLGLAFIFMLTMVGMPSIFYGDECYMEGEKENDYRAAMNWQHTDTDLFALLKRLIAIRKSHAAFVKGSYEPILIEGEQRVLAYRRILEGEEYMVILNNKEADYPLPATLVPEEYENMLSGKRYGKGEILEGMCGVVICKQEK